MFDYNDNLEEVSKEIKEKFNGVDCVFDCVAGKSATFHCDILS